MPKPTVVRQAINEGAACLFESGGCDAFVIRQSENQMKQCVCQKEDARRKENTYFSDKTEEDILQLDEIVVWIDGPVFPRTEA